MSQYAGAKPDLFHDHIRRHADRINKTSLGTWFATNTKTSSSVSTSNISNSTRNSTNNIVKGHPLIILFEILNNLLADDESRATMIESLASAEEQAISLAFDVSYGSKEEIVRNSGISLLYLLCGGMPSMSDIEEVEEAVERDFPVNWWSFK